MRARYKLTNELSELINRIRERMLGYSYEDFSEIMGIETSTCFYLCKKRNKESYVIIERLLKIFAIEYNCNLFINKYSAMEEILNRAIADGEIKPGTTMQMIFGTKPRIDIRLNPRSIVPPKEIFLNQSYEVDEKFFVEWKRDKNIFKEELFDENLRYIYIPEDDYIAPEELPKSVLEKLTKEELKKRVSDHNKFKQYLSRRLDELVKKAEFSDEAEYWLYALYLTYKEVNICKTCWEFIKKCYFTEQDKEHAWRKIFIELGKNRNLKRIKQFEDEDRVYFADKKDIKIDKEHFPIFYYRYRPSDIKGSPAEIKKYISKYYDEECENAVKARIKLVHLFMIVYQFYLREGMSEEIAFRETCVKLHIWDVDIPFNHLNLFPLPKVDNVIHMTTDTFRLSSHIMTFFNDKEIDDPALIQFRDNLRAVWNRFFNIIAVDFSFIKNIDNIYDAELHMHIANVIKKYKHDNLL